MVAFESADPIAVLIGAKRASSTLVHTLAVHPDHRRRGHGRHLLTSLSSKLSILGPPALVAEVEDTFDDARRLFAASGYAPEATLTDYVWAAESGGSAVHDKQPLQTGSIVIPISTDDLLANDLLGGTSSPRCWERSVQTLTARKDDISGVAVASDERIETSLLYADRGGDADVLSLRCNAEDEGNQLAHLLRLLQDRGIERLYFPKVHADEISSQLLTTLGFRSSATYTVYGTTARAQ